MAASFRHRSGRVRMRPLSFWTILLLAAARDLLFPAPLTAGAIVLRPGFQQIIDCPDVTRISIGNPEVVEATPLTRRDGILLVGKKEGTTDLIVWGRGNRAEWSIEVREKKALPFEEARAFAGVFPGVTVTEAGRSVIIGGTVPTKRDKTLLESFAGSRPGVFLHVSLPEDRKALLSYDLKIIELGRGVASQLGIRWPDSLGLKSNWSAGSGDPSVFAVAGDFEARLNLLVSDGRARLLANPRLVCESGESAQFLAGGEIPIVIATPETRTVEWKTYGIILRLQPKLDQGNRILTQITAEISTVDHGSGGPVPAFLTRRVATFFSSPAGSTVMLSGLVRSEMSKDVARLPLLGRIPVLGELFKSRTFRENQSELAVFITPSEVSGDSHGELSSWSQRAEDEKNAMRFRLVD